MYVEQNDNVRIIHVRDDLDVASSPHLASALTSAEEAGEPLTVVSLADCGYCDSSALTVLARAKGRRQGALAIVVPPENRQVRRIFEITGLLQELAVQDDLAGAFRMHNMPEVR